MKKLVLLMIVAIYSLCSFAQGNNGDKQYAMQLDRYEQCLKKSCRWQYGALGCATASVACFAGYASLKTKFRPMFENSEKMMMRKNAKLYLAGGSVFAALAIICEIRAIDYKLASGKALKLHFTENGARLALNF